MKKKIIEENQISKLNRVKLFFKQGLSDNHIEGVKYWNDRHLYVE